MSEKTIEQQLAEVTAERDQFKTEVLLAARTGKKIIETLGLDKAGDGIRPVISAIGDIMQAAMFDPDGLAKKFEFLAEIGPLIDKYKDQI